MKRKNVMRLIVCGVVAGAMAAMLALSGCGGSQASSSNGSSNSGNGGQQVELQIFAANSLEKALPEVQELYTKSHSNVTFKDTQFKASGDLVQQLTADNSAADVLITASTKTMDKAADLISSDTRTDMFTNDLVVTTKKDSDIKITSLEAENVKRVRAVQLHPSATGLTIIGGNNNQGKTSLLDTIAWALGGDRFRPSMATREGSTIPPHIKVTLSNGLIVERRGKNSDLKVIDPSGSKAGQQLLNAFIEQLALDLPRFMQASDREKADTLLRIIGVGEQLAALERKEQEQYNERLAIGRIADQKAKYAKEQPYWPDAPDELISASDLIRQQQAILARNGENQSKRAMASLLDQQVSTLTARVDELHRQLQTAEDELIAKMADLATARKTAEQLVDESTEELERSIADIETINAKVRDNLNREKAEEDARAYQQQYDSLTAEIEQLREDKRALLDGAKLPMEGLGVADGALTYHGQKWDNMSGSEQLRVATAIVRCLKPQCGFVLLDKLEQMDLGTLREFGAWLESEGLQAIATRVSTGDECSIIIEDGYVQGEEQPLPDEPQSTWKAGAF